MEAGCSSWTGAEGLRRALELLKQELAVAVLSRGCVPQPLPTLYRKPRRLTQSLWFSAHEQAPKVKYWYIYTSIPAISTVCTCFLSAKSACVKHEMWKGEKGQLSQQTQHCTCSQAFGKHRGKVSHLYPQFKLYKLLENSIIILSISSVAVSQAANDHFTPECFESSLWWGSHTRGSQAPGQVSLAFNLSRAETH